jgi:hypothetical protein
LFNYFSEEKKVRYFYKDAIPANVRDPVFSRFSGKRWYYFYGADFSTAIEE